MSAIAAEQATGDSTERQTRSTTPRRRGIVFWIVRYLPPRSSEPPRW